MQMSRWNLWGILTAEINEQNDIYFRLQIYLLFVCRLLEMIEPEYMEK